MIERLWGGEEARRYVLLYSAQNVPRTAREQVVWLCLTVVTAIIDIITSGLLTWGKTDMLLHCWAHGFTGWCTENHKTAGVSKCFLHLRTAEGGKGLFVLQWPLDDRATLRAIRSLISPCPPLQNRLSSIKVKINDWKRDRKNLLWARRCLFCEQGNCNQAEKKTNPDFSWWVFHWSVLQNVAQHPASRWHYWIILTETGANVGFMSYWRLLLRRLNWWHGFVFCKQGAKRRKILREKCKLSSKKNWDGKKGCLSCCVKYKDWNTNTYLITILWILMWCVGVLGTRSKAGWM